MSVEYTCEMVPAPAQIVHSEEIVLNVMTGEVIGTRHEVDCPGIKWEQHNSPRPMMYLDEDFGSDYHHTIWKRWLKQDQVADEVLNDL